MASTLQKVTIAFDVNNTLSLPLVQKLFSGLDRNKFHLIVWSSLGVEYVKNYCDEFNLHPDEIMEKQARQVDIALDDFPDSIHSAEVVLGVRERL